MNPGRGEYWSPGEALRSRMATMQNFWGSNCAAAQKIKQEEANSICRDVKPVDALPSVQTVSFTGELCTGISLPLLRWGKHLGLPTGHL